MEEELAGDKPIRNVGAALFLIGFVTFLCIIGIFCTCLGFVFLLWSGYYSDAASKIAYERIKVILEQYTRDYYMFHGVQVELKFASGKGAAKEPYIDVSVIGGTRKTPVYYQTAVLYDS